MKKVAILIVLCAIVVCAGCTMGPYSVRDQENPTAETIPSRLTAESDTINGVQNELTRSLEKLAPRTIDIEPLMPAYDPLADHTVSFSAVDEDLQTVLYSLSRAVGMNLIIDPNIIDEKKHVTLNFEKVSAATVLKELLHNFDLYYEVAESIIRIKPFQERTFRLNFLDTNLTTNFDVGGDVLGAAQTDTASGLQGNFRLSGTGAKNPNPYDVIENTVKKVVSPSGGIYSLNRISGSLYIKDTPAVIKTIAILINQFKEMMSRQILIEARIIEVDLSEGYQYGIDWDILRNEMSSASMLNSAGWSQAGLVLSGVTGAFTSNATIRAFNVFGDVKIVSNPTIRTKHGQPAIISVGTSLTYKEKITRERVEDSAARERETTEVEVSTVFDGLILGVIPFIESSGKITLLINPIKSDVDLESLDPKDETGQEDVALPRVGIKEISTTIGAQSGDIIILGGLINKRKAKANKGVPFFSSIPLLGYIFKHESLADETRELVIMLRVTII
jgi:MSHA type pilus biogenesis protein MshL